METQNLLETQSTQRDSLEARTIQVKVSLSRDIKVINFKNALKIMAKLTAKEKIKVWVAGIVAVLAVGFVVFGLLNPDQRSPAQITKDSLCRSLIQDGQAAKTQSERDYAQRKFVTNCADWTDSRQKQK